MIPVAPLILRADGTIAIILGARDWRNMGFGEAPSFERSSEGIHLFVTDTAGLGLRPTVVLNLFDDARSASDQLIKIHEFVERCVEGALIQGGRIADVLVYFVGHGCTDGSGHLCLLIRSSNEKAPFQTGIQIAALAGMLRASAARQRRIFILDCCFSEAALRDLWAMSGMREDIVAASALKELSPGEVSQQGTLLFLLLPSA
jgi:hypothetical protein